MGPSNPKRTWFLTYPQNESTINDLLSALSDIAPILEYVIAQEPHQDGTPHLHAYIKFKGDGIKFKDAPSTFNVLSKTGNYQPCRSPKAVVTYCTKGDNHISNFDIDNYKAKKGKLAVSTIKAKSARQALEDGDISIFAIRNYTLARSILVEPYKSSVVRGLWIHGPTGTGKSHSAREHYPKSYLKPQSKWWDGYEGQESVILDDLDTPVLGHYLKIWSDKYACQGEVKGGVTSLAHRQFIVTSNNSIEELFSQRPEFEIMIGPLLRRFRVVEKLTRSTSILVPTYDPTKPI